MSKISIAIDSTDVFEDQSGSLKMRQKKRVRDQQHRQNPQYLSPLGLSLSPRGKGIDLRIACISGTLQQDDLYRLKIRTNPRNRSPSPSNNPNRFSNFSKGRASPFFNHKGAIRYSNNSNSIDFYLTNDESRESIISENEALEENIDPTSKQGSSIVTFQQDLPSARDGNVVKALQQVSEDSDDEDELDDETLAQYRLYGMILLTCTAVYLVVGLGSMFNVWKYLGFWSSSSMVDKGDFPVDNYYVYVFLLYPPIFWIWCIVSWVGMKLFRHAKGIAMPE